MYMMFRHMEFGDEYLGPFATLSECEIVTEREMERLNESEGIKKAQFYALDENGKRVVGWIIGVKEEW